MSCPTSQTRGSQNSSGRVTQDNHLQLAAWARKQECDLRPCTILNPVPLTILGAHLPLLAVTKEQRVTQIPSDAARVPVRQRLPSVASSRGPEPMLQRRNGTLNGRLPRAAAMQRPARSRLTWRVSAHKQGVCLSSYLYGPCRSGNNLRWAVALATVSDIPSVLAPAKPKLCGRIALAAIDAMRVWKREEDKGNQQGYYSYPIPLPAEPGTPSRFGAVPSIWPIGIKRKNWPELGTLPSHAISFGRCTKK